MQIKSTRICFTAHLIAWLLPKTPPKTKTKTKQTKKELYPEKQQALKCDVEKLELLGTF